MKILIIEVEPYRVKVPKIASCSLQFVKCGVFSDTESLLNELCLLLLASTLILGSNHYH